MNEALAISAANLDVIEKNLNSVATELSGVINNVNDVNNQVTNVENKVDGLNNEVKNLIKEIRETTIITNAKQNIMFNNDQIDKKYGYFDKVRRNVISILDSIDNSNISKDSMVKLREELLLNNPNYWLSNALSALISWMLDDKENAEKELNNSLKKDTQKTNLFFSLIYLKLGRYETALNWLNSYLDNENPNSLSKEFVVILDLVSTGAFKVKGKELIISKITNWYNLLSNNNEINQRQLNKWLFYIENKKDVNIKLPYLENYTNDYSRIINNLQISSTYENTYLELNDIVTKNDNITNIDVILNRLIYEYEKEESIFQKDNLKNKLILECNGDLEKAEELYQKEVDIYDERTNFIDLLNNIVLNSNRYNVSDETIKFALSLIKNNILKSYEILNNNVNEESIKIDIDNISVETNDGSNIEEAKNIISNILKSEHIVDDKYMIFLIAIINIIGVMGIIFMSSYSFIQIFILFVLVVTNIYLIYSIIKKKILNNRQMKEKENILYSNMERIFAEVTEYKNIIKEKNKDFDKLNTFLDNIKIENYLKTNDERNIMVGEK